MNLSYFIVWKNNEKKKRNKKVLNGSVQKREDLDWVATQIEKEKKEEYATGPP